MRKLCISFLLFSLLAGQALAAPALKAGVFEPPRAAPALALSTGAGKPFKLDDYRGKVVLLAFGYTHCEAVCPVTLAMLAQAMQQLGADAAGVQVVFASVDPERDDAARMGTYVRQFDPRFAGLTGSRAQVDAVMQAYGITSQKHPAGAGNYVIAHSSYIYYIDRKGMLRALQPFGRPAADVVHDVRALLKEPA
jgi:protein SCO1/2